MDNITQYLNLEKGSKILDLACGKGRHSLYLNELGYDVTGADLSVNSIAEASRFENSTLHFKVHDMREPFPAQFDAVFNLFTSFGYFDDDDDNLKTLKAIRDSLNEYGLGVIDFMNVQQVIENLVPKEVKEVDGIEFNISRMVIDHHIIKEIRFTDGGRDYHFTEKVRALDLAEFEQMMEMANISLLDVFGDYRLKKFNPATSDRLIMVFK